jgi:hypothetical protein
MEIDFLGRSFDGEIATDGVPRDRGTVTLRLPGPPPFPYAEIQGLVRSASGVYEASSLTGKGFQASLTPDGRLTGEWWVPQIRSDDDPPRTDLKPLDFEVAARARMIVRQAGIRVMNRGRTTTYRGLYPEFVNPTPLDRAAETWARSTLRRSALEFTSVYRDFHDAWETFRHGSTIVNTWICDESCSIRFRSDRFVSLLFESYIQTGGAHGNFRSRSSTFYSSGRETARLELADLFRPGSNWESELIRRLAEEDRRQGIAYQSGERLEGKSLEILSCWTIERDGLHFLFDPYVIGSFADGTQEITLPFDQILDLLRDSGPAADLPRENGQTTKRIDGM